MRSIEDKGCLSFGPSHENPSNNTSNKFEFHKGNGTSRGFGKPTPSKWDDAQKWLVNLSRGGGGSGSGGGGGGERNESNRTQKPRDSNADDRRLIAPVPTKEDYSSGGEDLNGEEIGYPPVHFEVETKNVDCEEPVWRINRPSRHPNSSVRSICVRDMGTEMTPIASQEPSRTGTPIRATSPVTRSPIASGSTTPVGTQQQRVQGLEGSRAGVESRGGEGWRGGGGDLGGFGSGGRGGEKMNSERDEKPSALETRAVAWDEAEKAKYMARYKREEVKIQAWENHEKRKAEMEMRRMEVKAERLKARAQERLANKLAATRRIAEEKLANAEAKLNEKAVRTSEHADYMRTGHLPSSFSFKLPSFCW